MKTQEMRSRITSGGLDRAFDYLYSEKAPLQRERYEAAVGEFEKLFGAGREVGLFSAPGRTEVGGNHTDHQQGRVLAAGRQPRRDRGGRQERRQRHPHSVGGLPDGHHRPLRRVGAGV